MWHNWPLERDREIKTEVKAPTEVATDEMTETDVMLTEMIAAREIETSAIKCMSEIWTLCQHLSRENDKRQRSRSKRTR